MDTKVGQSEKDDPAEVVETGVATLLSSFAAGLVLAVDPPAKRPTLKAHLDEARQLK